MSAVSWTARSLARRTFWTPSNSPFFWAPNYPALLVPSSSKLGGHVNSSRCFCGKTGETDGGSAADASVPPSASSAEGGDAGKQEGESAVAEGSSPGAVTTATEGGTGGAEVVAAEGEATKSTAKQRQEMKPKEMVSHLDQYVIGQKDAKKAVANAVRSRWRRQLLPEEMRPEVVPKNILMVGPTGVGKTEIARRLAKLVDAPFIKVEATKFTEVGFHGRDVDQIIRDLVEVSMKRQKSRLEEELTPKAEEEVEDRILDALMGTVPSEAEKQTWLKHLRSGGLDDRQVTLDVPTDDSSGSESGQQGGMPGMKVIKIVPVQGGGGVGVSGGGGQQTEKKKLSVKDAKKKLLSSALEKMISQDDVVGKAIESAEQEGIVFIDEIDKIAQAQGRYHGGDASAEGVQRDLLPIIEGSEVSTKYGNVKTDYMLFICSGAFSAVKPSDLLAELQGRLPVRVALQALTEDDLFRILTEPKHNIVTQSKELLKTEGVTLCIDDTTTREIAKVSQEINSHMENIGARRLHTVVEKLLEDISFRAPEMAKDPQTSEPVISSDQVRTALGNMLKKTDLHKFIL